MRKIFLLERKPSNAAYGTYFTLTILAVCVTWHKFGTSDTTRRYMRDKLSHLSETMAVHLSGIGGLEVACWPLVPKFAGSNPAGI
jgi:hypothetical protein